MASTWMYQKNGVEVGPISSAELKRLAESGGLEPGDLVKRDGMSGYAPASRVKGLFPTDPTGNAAVAQPHTPAGTDATQRTTPAITWPAGMQPRTPAGTDATQPAATSPGPQERSEESKEPEPDRPWYLQRDNLVIAFVVVGGAIGFFARNANSNKQKPQAANRRAASQSSSKSRLPAVRDAVVTISEKYQQVNQRARSTPRIALGGPISEMQALLKEAQAIPTAGDIGDLKNINMSPGDKVAEYIRANFIMGLDYQIKGWLAIMSGGSGAGTEYMELSAKYFKQMGDAARNPRSIVPDYHE